MVFIGYLLGSWVFGYIADRYGRKRSLLISSLWLVVFGLLSAASPGLAFLLVLRCLVGVGIAGSPQALVYYAEFLPIASRGPTIV